MPVSISTPTPVIKTQCVFNTPAWNELVRSEEAVYCAYLGGVINWVFSKVLGIKEQVEVNFGRMHYENYLICDLQNKKFQNRIFRYMMELEDWEEDHSVFQLKGKGVFEDSVEPVEFRITPFFDRLVLETPTRRFTATHGDFQFHKLIEVFLCMDYLLDKRCYGKTLELSLPGATDEELVTLDKTAQLMAKRHKAWPVTLRIKR